MTNDPLRGPSGGWAFRPEAENGRVKRTIHAPVQPLVRRLEQIGGLSRQGVIATSRWVQDYRLPTASQQVLWLFPASAMIGA